MGSKRLLLHLDVNKTLLLYDRASEKALSHLLIDTLCELAKGEVQGGQWVWNGRSPFEGSPDDIQHFISYGTYVDDLMQFKPGEDNSIIKKAKDELRVFFFAFCVSLSSLTLNCSMSRS